MPLQMLKKTPHILGKNGLWGTFNNAAGLTCSKDGYLLSLTPTDIGRLDDMTLSEEKTFWDFTFTHAAEGINSPEKRGVEVTPESMKPCNVLFALNDGVDAWQNVRTTHGHIVWTSTPDAIGDMQEHLNNDRLLLSGTSSSDYRPHAYDLVNLAEPNFVEKIRNTRQSLRDICTEAAHGPTSFSLYTAKPTLEDPRAGSDLVIEAWSKNHPSIASLSQFIRYWHKLVPSPMNPDGVGLKYAGFEHD